MWVSDGFEQVLLLVIQVRMPKLFLHSMGTVDTVNLIDEQNALYIILKLRCFISKSSTNVRDSLLMLPTINESHGAHDN